MGSCYGNQTSHDKKEKKQDLGGWCCPLGPWRQVAWAISWSMALQQPGSRVMSMVPVSTEGCTDAQSLVATETILMLDDHTDLGGL